MHTFAVGDIHGHLEKLDALLPLLLERARPGDALVFVGDYIDRGPDSRGVVDRILELRDGAWKGPVTTLKGNHEELLLDYLSPRPKLDPVVWLENGGARTAESYTPDGWSPGWTRAIPPRHIEFYRALASWHEDDDGIYVHAGIQPGYSPADCPDSILQWIREEFIDSDYEWSKVVVFGHTPQFEPPAEPLPDLSRLEWRPLNRPEKIGIDTGAAYGGPLSAVMLPEREFFSSAAAPRESPSGAKG